MKLKIVTYNIKSGIYHPDGLEAIARVLEQTEADVVALQEVDCNTRRSGNRDQPAWLAQRLAMPYHCFGCATPWDGGGEYGVALISSLPLVDQRLTHLWVPSGTEVSHGAREPRVALSSKIDGTPLTVMVTHLGLTEEQRVRQARQLVELAHEAAGKGDVALMGDFNGTPDSPEVQLLSDELDDVLAHVPQEERITFPSGDPEMHGEDFLARTIDYVFVSSGTRVERPRVVAEETLASDHNPCEAVIAMPGNGSATAPKAGNTSAPR